MEEFAERYGCTTEEAYRLMQKQYDGSISGDPSASASHIAVIDSSCRNPVRWRVLDESGETSLKKNHFSQNRAAA